MGRKAMSNGMFLIYLKQPTDERMNICHCFILCKIHSIHTIILQFPVVESKVLNGERFTQISSSRNI